MNTTKILIIGSGAIGSFYGSILHRGGAQVSYICRSDFDIVKKNGITINSKDYNYNFHPHKIFKSGCKFNYNADFVIIATKVLPEIDVPFLLEGTVSSNSTIVLLQNGIYIEESVEKAYPHNEIISALAFVCVNRISPGITSHLDYGRIVIGTYPNGITPQAKKLQELFTKGNIDCQIDEDVLSARWRKLLWNAPFNPISVLAGGADTREMTSHEPTIALVKAVMHEIHALSIADGHELSIESIDKNINDSYKMVPYKTSMLLDYEAKRPMEVEAILGNTVRLAKKLNVEVPHIESLYGTLSLLNIKNQEKT
jgi:2-dehydropantoate 2-reductase